MRDSSVARGGVPGCPEAATITLVTELYPPAVGGSAVLFHEIYRRIGACDVRVLTGTEGAAEPGDARVVRCPVAPYWGIARASGLKHHIRVARLLGAYRPRQVVHTGRALPEGVAAWLAWLQFGTPYICWNHGEDLTMARRSRELCWLTRRVCRRASALFANSRSTARLLEGYGVHRDRIHIVYPGVDAQRFARATGADAIRRHYAPTGELLLLSIGRLQRRKGHDMVIRALALLRSEGMHVRYVVGSTGNQRAALDELAASLGVAEHVVFVGDIPAERLPAFYAACDVFVLPNRIDDGDIEGFGIVFLEAAASARPVIGGNSGGVPEAVEDGVTGLLVSGTSAGELARAIRRLSCSPELRTRLGDAGRRRVLEHFTWERAARIVADVHHDVAARIAGSHAWGARVRPHGSVPWM